MKAQHQPSLPVMPCACANLRRASRALTQLYEQALRPTGLRATQFTILQMLELSGELLQGELGERLVLDSTTLTRTLAIMIRRGWITKRQGKDRRERRLRVSRRGHQRFEQALEHWENVQATLRRRLGNQRWEALFDLTNQLTTLAVQKGELP